MIRMLIIGYCLGIRSERRLCEEVKLNLAYRWFCRLRKPIVQTIGCYNFSRTVSFALQVGMGLKYSCSMAESSFVHSNPVRFRNPPQGKCEFADFPVPVTVNFLQYSFNGTYPPASFRWP